MQLFLRFLNIPNFEVRYEFTQSMLLLLRIWHEYDPEPMLNNFFPQIPNTASVTKCHFLCPCWHTCTFRTVMVAPFIFSDTRDNNLSMLSRSPWCCQSNWSSPWELQWSLYILRYEMKPSSRASAPWSSRPTGLLSHSTLTPHSPTVPGHCARY